MALEAVSLIGCASALAAVGLSSNPGASSAARSSELVGEGGVDGVGGKVTPLLGLPLRNGAAAADGPCRDGSVLTDGEAGVALSLRGLPLGLTDFAAAATVAASAAASTGVLHCGQCR